MTTLPKDITAHLDKIYDLVTDLGNLFECWKILNWELAQLTPGSENFRSLRSALIGHHDATQRVFADLRVVAER